MTIKAKDVTMKANTVSQANIVTLKADTVTIKVDTVTMRLGQRCEPDTGLPLIDLWLKHPMKTNTFTGKACTLTLNDCTVTITADTVCDWSKPTRFAEHQQQRRHYRYFLGAAKVALARIYVSAPEGGARAPLPLVPPPLPRALCRAILPAICDWATIPHRGQG